MNVLLIGGTGYLGSRIAKAIKNKGYNLYALVRKNSKTDSLQEMGATLVIGDLTDEKSLINALSGIQVVISTAIGYTNRRPEDTILTVDDQGNRNLANAIKKTGVSRLIFLSVLKSDIAQDVAHFKQKYLTEQYFEQKGIHFISLRPGGFLDQVLGWSIQDIRKGQVPVMMDPQAHFTLINSTDIVRIVLQAIDIDTKQNLIIDLGMKQATSLSEVAREISAQTGKPLAVIQYPAPEGEMGDTLAFISSGKYIADTTLQEKYFGEPAGLKESIGQWLESVGLK